MHHSPTESQSLVDCYSDGFDDDDDACLDDAISSIDFLSNSINSNNHDISDSKITTIKSRQFRVLKEDDIRQLMDDDVTQLSSVLSLPKPEASLLLFFFNWSVSKTLDSWCSDESAVREKVGLLLPNHNPISISENNNKVFSICGICFESFSNDIISTANCGHPYCNECWFNYISTSINNDGFRCLMLRCPDPNCSVAISPSMIEKLVSLDDKRKYLKCLIRSYIEGKRRMKWCPGRDCDYAIEIFDGDFSFDVTCDCFTSFCWNCGEECHRPVDCETVKKWISKNNSESANVNYILHYCKPCPNCKRPIEKNEGCMRMKCRVCSHSFCWLCLCSLANHKQCNGYEDIAVRKKQMAEQSLEKYTHFFERWDANRQSKLKALADFQQVKDDKFERLSQIHGIAETNLDFITKAWLQVVECRRVLEWSYAYGYYLPDNEVIKKQFFEYLQGEAESGLEKLHNCAEKELNQFLVSGSSSIDFMKFRTKLVGLTFVTGNYFEKLVRALENGLSDVVVSVSGGASSSRDDNEMDDFWYCDRCNYANPGVSMECRMCFLAGED